MSTFNPMTSGMGSGMNPGELTSRYVLPTIEE